MDKKTKLAEKYLDLFSKKSTIDKANIQRWIPIVAATQLTKGNKEEQRRDQKFPAEQNEEKQISVIPYSG
jgi:hypothetical protein